MEILKYNSGYEQLWDDFVLNKAINGTFLQTRNFLNYHPQDRFDDCSMVINKKGKLIAVIPACEIKEKDKRTFFSHKGSTFGGIVVSEECYNAETLLQIVELLDANLRDINFDKIILRITPDIFSKVPLSLMEYCLFYRGYDETKELNTYIDYDNYNVTIKSNLTQGKRTHYNNCIKSGMTCQRLTSDEEIEAFYQILSDNLIKFNVKPVHTLYELLEFKNRWLKNEVSFWGGYLGDTLVTGSMMFHFDNCACAHAQYLCARQEYNTLSPMTFMYCKMIEIMRELGYKKLSWGIATENSGKTLNLGLIKAKESYGSRHSVNRTFYKNLK